MGLKARPSLPADAFRSAETFWNGWRAERARRVLLPISIIFLGFSVLGALANFLVDRPTLAVVALANVPIYLIALFFTRYHHGEKWVWLLPYAVAWGSTSYVILRGGGIDGAAFPAAMVLFFIMGVTLQSRLHAVYFILFVGLNVIGWMNLKFFAPQWIQPYDPHELTMRGAFMAVTSILYLTMFLMAEKAVSREVVDVAARAIAAEVNLAREEDIHQAKNALLSHVSHELLTPLTSVLGFAELLRENHVPHEEAALYALRIQEQTERAVALVANILDFTSLETGQFKVEIRGVSLHELITEIVASHQPAFASRQLHLRLQFDASFPEFSAVDKTVVKKVIDNLLSNALRFTVRGGVDVRCAMTDQMLNITVSDTGRGIGAELLPKLFESFTREKKQATQPISGAGGLGLALARRLARLVGGDVILVSTQPGEGSCFALELPFTEENISPPQTS